MSFCSVLSAAVIGLRVEFIHVEADVSNGLPVFHMVGYLSSEVKEAAERVRTAIRNSGVSFPAKRTIVNLAPANVRKRGASFDLPIAVAVMIALGCQISEGVRHTLFIGELGLDGSVLEVPGVLPIVLEAKKAGVKRCIVPEANEAEGALVKGIEIIGVKHLKQITKILSGERKKEKARNQAKKQTVKNPQPDFSEMQGQAAVKRAAEIAVDASVYDNKKSVTIVEIMGRHAGWLTAASALARKFEGDNPVLIYLPEVAFDTERFIQDVSASLEKVSNVIVCISEGINDGKGTFICELASEVGVDTFGHKMLTGSGKYLENLIKDRLGVKVRSVELNVSQRCSSAMLSATDLQEAVDSGAYGVKCALHGESGKMIAFVRADGEEYKLSYEAKDVNEICNREKGVPAGWITKDGSDVSDEFIRYAKPLIQGEVQVPQQDGLPLFAYRK